MLLKILVAGWFAVAPPVSTTCGNGSTAQTQSVAAPDGSSAVLKVSSEDDHAKDTHLCMADYRLSIAQQSGQPKDVDLLSSDNDWGRKISIQLSGFSHDGKRIIGMLTEGGSSPAQEIFDYNSEDGNTLFFDLPKLAAHNFPLRCLAFSELLGTTNSGAIVLQLRAGKYCAHTSRWLLTSVKGPLRRAPKNGQVQELYRAGAMATH